MEFYRVWGKRVLLGMDWLSANQAFLDCKGKRVVTKSCNCEMGVIFQGSFHDPSSCILLVNEATKLFSESCQAFLANIVECESISK